MVKKIIFGFFFLIFLFYFTNYNFILGNFYSFVGNYFYNKGDYALAITYHEKGLNKSDYKNYNLGNDYYKLGNYTEAINYYNKIKYKNDFFIFHNLGNAFYKKGESIKESESKILLWNGALKYYKFALEIKENLQTKGNYYFVKDKLDKLIKESENNQKNENKQENNQNKDDKNNDNKNLANNEKQNNNQQEQLNNLNNEPIKQERASQYILGNNKEIQKITKQEKDFLDNYIKTLKEGEKLNQQFFNKKEDISDSDFNKIYDIFSENPNFDSKFDNGGEKDW